MAIVLLRSIGEVCSRDLNTSVGSINSLIGFLGLGPAQHLYMCGLMTRGKGIRNGVLMSSLYSCLSVWVTAI